MSPDEIYGPRALEWEAGDFVEVRADIFGATYDTEQLTVTVYRYEPGSEWEAHDHPEDQVTFVHAGGTIEFVVAGQPMQLGPGALAVIPGGVSHSARVDAASQRVVTINTWRRRSPPR